MARGVRVRISSSGARAVLGDESVALALGDMAARIRDKANSMASPDDMFNDPYDYDLKAGGSRARASVFTASPHGIRNNNKHNTLLKSLDAGR